VLSWLLQVLAVTRLNLRSLPRRLGASAVATLGIAGVVVVFVSVLSIAQGFRATLAAAGDPRAALVMSAGSEEISSHLPRESAQLVKDAPGILQGASGPLASAELFVIVNHRKRSTGTLANLPLRGMERAGFEVRSGARIVEGRGFGPGRFELVAGRAASRQFEELDVGRRVTWGADTWTVVGIFEAEGAVSESELWCDVRVLQAAYRRGNAVSSVHVRLESPAAFAAFRDALASDPRLEVDVLRETEHFAEQSAATTRLVTTLGYAIAALMGAGAVFGAVNTMLTAVASRGREIATLRALGFARGPVVLSVLAESAVLAAAGGVMGAALAWAVFDGRETSTLNWQTYTQVAFAFAVTPGLLVQGALYGTLIGLAGGLLPAARAARLPVATALREL
jgi:putative ABC transport system permease protein